MGYNNSKVSSNAVTRMLEYEQIAATENEGLKRITVRLETEEWRDGLISVRTMFNMFHAGYCSAYVQNPSYMLIVDIRFIENWIVERVLKYYQVLGSCLPHGHGHFLSGSSIAM